VETFSYRVAIPNDMLNAFENATDIDVRPIWVHWFNERQGVLDIKR